MGGYFPGIPGFVAFAGVKFGGYYLAGMTLKKWQPVIMAGALKIAGTRTGLGILIGPPLTLAMGFAASEMFPHLDANSNPIANVLASIGAFGFVYVLRVLIWALVLRIFTKGFELPRSTFWKYSALGAVWSFVLDLPGIGLALIAPGQIPIC
jgi:hypothetical protein